MTQLVILYTSIHKGCPRGVYMYNGMAAAQHRLEFVCYNLSLLAEWKLSKYAACRVFKKLESPWKGGNKYKYLPVLQLRNEVIL